MNRRSLVIFSLIVVAACKARNYNQSVTASTSSMENLSQDGGLKGSWDDVPSYLPKFLLNGGKTKYPVAASAKRAYEKVEDSIHSPPISLLAKHNSESVAAAKKWLEDIQNYVYDDMNDQSDDPNLNFRLTKSGNSPRSTRWYHMPWLHSPEFTLSRPGRGREGVWGLTREVDMKGPIDETFPLVFSKKCVGQNWGVAFFNEMASTTIKKVFVDGEGVGVDYTSASARKKSEQNANFEKGAVIYKLLFTSVPHSKKLEGAYVIDALVNKGGDCIDFGDDETRMPTKMYHVQMDIQYKFGDGYNDWMFATYVYNRESNPDISEFKNNRQKKYWKGMEPLGVQWGVSEKETLLVSKTLFPNGYTEEGKPHSTRRLNGPADNPFSSCFQCHARSQWPHKGGGKTGSGARLPFAPDGYEVADDKLAICVLHEWKGDGGCAQFGKLPCTGENCGELLPGKAPVDTQRIGLGYSLQLELALANRQRILQRALENKQ